jgi:Tol biopolymer transport system component
VKGLSKFPIFDMRLLGAIAAVLIALTTLSNSEPVQENVRPRIARGEHGAQIASFALSPTSALIATTNYAGRVTLRAPEREWQIERYMEFPGYATAVAFSPDGRYLAAVGNPPGICLWDLVTARNKPTKITLVSIQDPQRIIFSSDGQYIAVTSCLDGTILLWDLATRRDRMVLHQSSPVVSVAFSPDGRWLATAGRVNRSILIWDLQCGSPRSLQEGEPAGVTIALAFSPDGALLASAGLPEHHVRLWDLETRRVCREFAGHERSVISVAFSPDGSLLATAGNDGMLGLWTVTTGERLLSLDGQAGYPRTVAFSPDGRTITLATGNDDDIRLWYLAELPRARPGSNSLPIELGPIPRQCDRRNLKRAPTP